VTVYLCSTAIQYTSVCVINDFFAPILIRQQSFQAILKRQFSSIQGLYIVRFGHC
jgi:hypothetical protein